MTDMEGRSVPEQILTSLYPGSLVAQWSYRLPLFEVNHA